MVIIRRNPDGSIANPDMVRQQTQSQNEQTQVPQPVSHPALASKRGMAALQDVGRAIPPLYSEIAMKVNNAKDKPRKLKVLQRSRFSCFKTGFKRCISSRCKMGITKR